MGRFTDVFTELVRVEIELWNGLDAHLLATSGVSLPQFHALDAIRSHSGQARVQDISRQMAITAGAASKVVDRVERDGLATRAAHPTDGRSSIVTLTARGASVLQEADDAAESHLRSELGVVLSDAAAGRLLGELVSLRVPSRVGVTK